MCESVLEGHTEAVKGIAITNDEHSAYSASFDGTIREWDLDSGICVREFGDGLGGLVGVHLARDGSILMSGSLDGHASLWRLDSPRAAMQPRNPLRYTNAKVILVGDSGVGKTGLAIRLAKDEFEVTASTDGHWATQLQLSCCTNETAIDRDIWLWDFAGQSDYRLIHQMFMDEAALAALVFNPQSENPFDGLGQWDRDLTIAGRRGFAKLLVAGRCDRGGLTVSWESVEQFASDRRYQKFLKTSAKTGEGCQELREAIEKSIDWDSIPCTASPRIFKLLKEEIIRLSDEGFTLLRMSELKQQLEMRLPDDPFTYEELKAVVGLLAGPGHVWQLEFGQFVLLHPERINSYAAAVGRTVRSHLQQIGVIHESAMLAGQLNFGDIQRLPPREEAIVLRAMHQTLVDHGFCLTQETDAGPLLVFPSYFNRERRDQIDHPRIFGTCRFSGALEELYATLVVKLHHTRIFETEELWRYAADFRCGGSGAQVGLKMRKLGEGDAELIVYCDLAVAVESKVTFVQYIYEHLKRYDPKVTLVRHYVCPNDECGEALSDVKAILRARERGRTHLTCQYCDESIRLWDESEQELASEKYEARVREMEATSRAGIKRESRDLQVEYHAFAIAEETSQNFVPVANDELGTQARIELTDLAGQPSGRSLHLQLRPDAVFKAMSSNLDGGWTFEVAKEAFVERWEQSESPVMLVHRTDDGYIYWMNAGAWLREQRKRRKTPFKQIVFDGEPFTALNLQQLRDRLVPQGE
jgi:small GTP-binding protein